MNRRGGSSDQKFDQCVAVVTEEQDRSSTALSSCSRTRCGSRPITRPPALGRLAEEKEAAVASVYLNEMHPVSLISRASPTFSSAM